jgi:photosystem II stability/assembly factor-like uncharacterized protein
LLLAACSEAGPVGTPLGDAGPQPPPDPVFEVVDLSQPAGRPPNYFGIWGTGPDDIFLVGEIGTVLHFDGTTWTNLNTTTSTRTLKSVWGTGSDNVYAVGAGGTVLHYFIPDAERNQPDAKPRWFQESTPTTVELNAVYGGNRNAVWAVGNAGTILARDPATQTWNIQPSGTVESLHGLWAARGDQGPAVAVGNLGAIIVFNGTGWARERIAGLTVPLRGAWGRNADNIHLMGLDGTLLRGGPGAWEPFEELPTVYLRSAFGFGARNVWVVGWNGTLLHVQGDQFEPYFEFTTRRLEAIWATREPDPDALPDEEGNIPTRPAIYVAGVSGTVLKGPFGAELVPLNR